MFAWFESRIDAFREVRFPEDATTLARFVWHFVRQVPLYLLAVAGLACFQAVLQALVYVYVGAAVNAINDAVAGAASDAMVASLVYLVPAVLVAQLAVMALNQLVSNQTFQTRFPPLVRWQSYRRVVRQGMSFFHADFTGRIANQVMETGQSLQTAIVQLVNLVCQLGVFVLSVAVIFSGLFWVFLVPLAVWLAACLATTAFFIPRLQVRSKENAEARSSLMGRIVDCYANIMTVKLFAGPEREDAYVLEGSMTLVDKASRTMRLYTGIAATFQTVNVALMISIFLLAVFEWRAGSLPIGGVVVATALAFRLQDLSWGIMNGLWQITSNVGTVQNGMTSIAAPLVLRPAGLGRTAPSDGPAITLSNLQFGYAPEKPVIAGVSLAISPKEKIGVVGPSGAGKSTIVGLVAGLYLAGTITVDGRDTATMSEAELRDLFSVVSQDTSLFNRSIRDNILYGRPDADEARLADALSKAKADEFVADLVDKQGRRGLDAHIGERGVRLSAGQRQRLAIARAIVKDAPILLLDEASSALDSATEEYIQSELAAVMRDKTVLVVAHRLSTLTRMNRIVVLDKGRVVETGSHGELIAAGGLYHHLWQLQARSAGAVAMAAQ
jgi:ATP-binding cassette subfamily B multidrug efflux pump